MGDAAGDSDLVERYEGIAFHPIFPFVRPTVSDFIIFCISSFLYPFLHVKLNRIPQCLFDALHNVERKEKIKEREKTKPKTQGDTCCSG